MAKVTGPLFSLTARNTIGKALTYSSWRGIPYVRTRVIPANPQSASQVSHREVWRTLSDMWLRMPVDFMRAWDADAIGRPYGARNRFFGLNVPALEGDANLTDLAFSPGHGGALPPLTAVPSSPGAGALTITCTVPTAPTGWTVNMLIAGAVLQGDPDPAIIRQLYSARDDVTPFTIALFTGLPTGTYVWGAWLWWMDPAGVSRFSIFLTGTPQAVA